MVSATRRSVGFISAEAFDILSQGEDFGELVVVLGVTCWRILMTCLMVSLRTWTDVSALPVVTDVLVSPSSVVTECYEDVFLD